MPPKAVETEILTEPARPLTVPAPKGRGVWVVVGALMLVTCVWAWLRVGRTELGPLQGPSTGWVAAKDKQALADYLERNVRTVGFGVTVGTVAKKQNYWGMARGKSINIDTVIGFNPDMEHVEAYIGRAVLLPNQVGTLHQVQPGDTVGSVEKDYGVASGTLRANNRVGWMGLRPGEVVFLPGARPRQFTPAMLALWQGRDFFRSPLAGHFTSFVGVRVDPFTGEKKHHNGVDIRAPFNALVAAAADGTVSLAGWNGGFGKCVIVDHASGYRTLYGHLNAILVKPGQHVSQYQYVGRVGMTGRTTGPHLHFTIWKNGKLQNPLKYLW